MRYGRLHGVNMPEYGGIRDKVVVLGPGRELHFWLRAKYGPFIVCHKPRDIDPGGGFEVVIAREAPDKRNARIMDHIEVAPNGKDRNLIDLAEEMARQYLENLQ